jgi:predicted enzyme related to lactoylglutathione lyase
MLKRIESVVFFVADIHAAARWYADAFNISHEKIEYENPKYAFIRVPEMLIGFHPADAKCPGGAGGSTTYWAVENIDRVREFLIARGATLYRGPAVTDFGEHVCMLVDPFGNTLGLHQATA